MKNEFIQLFEKLTNGNNPQLEEIEQGFKTNEQKEAMRAHVDGMRAQLDALALETDVPTIRTQIDWRPKRGQGKRIGGGMVVGAMSSNLGVRTYVGVDLSKYAQDILPEDWICLREHYRKVKYFTARRAKLLHWQAMYYAVSDHSSPQKRKANE
ncbi:hypothetical protein KC887_00590 [Candidatus Kaiserbacteria bacterium]|nr:hypothetical protein [Candidatus Kaiserbacteria bacterium]